MNDADRRQPTVPAGLAHLTSAGREIQAGGRPITIRDALAAPSGRVASLYMHVPFCFHKCHYCDFYSIVDRDDRQPVFTARLREEYAACAPWLTQTLETIFVGGGTPTLLAADHWRDILTDLAPRLGPETEFTVEANPETVTPEVLTTLRDGGVTRLSLGAQSFDPVVLRTLERHHDPANVQRSVTLARSHGFDRLSLDLIFGTPGQTLEGWQRDVRCALELEPDHLSCYGLTYEPGTAMTARLEAGQFERIDDGLEAQMYDWTCAELAAHGFEQYEISNWAQPGQACRHNLAYWQGAMWWPLGPSAAGHVDGWRWRNAPRLGTYLNRAKIVDGLGAVVDAEQTTPDQRIAEAFMLGLRLTQGIDRARYDALLRDDPRRAERESVIERGVAQGWLHWDDNALRVTAAGRLMADSILSELV